MTLAINQSTSFDAQLKDDKEIPFVNFTGSVDAKAVPSVNYYITNQDVYSKNVKNFRTAFMDFQNAVFDAADKKAIELDENTSTDEGEVPTE